MGLQYVLYPESVVKYSNLGKTITCYLTTYLV